MPSAVFIAFIPSSALIGSQTENPYCFRPLGLTDIVLNAGSRRIPNYDLKLNATTGDVQMALYETLKALNLLGGSTARAPECINRDTFGKAATLFGFDLSRDSKPNGPYVDTDFESSNLSISGNFNAATTASYASKSHVHIKCAYQMCINCTFSVMLFSIHQTGIIEINRFLIPTVSW